MFWNYLVIALYLSALFALGVRFGRRQNTTKSYYTGDSTLPAWAIGISLMATLISSVTFLAYPGQGYAGTWILLVQGLMVPPVLLCILWFIVPCYRRFIGISAYEYFERRFGYGARLYSSLAFLSAHFSKTGSVVYLMAVAVRQITGHNDYQIILLVGAVATVATLVGGMKAVIWTEVVQGIVLMGGGLICLAALLFLPTGHPSDVLRELWRSGKITLGPFDPTLSKVTFWVMALNGIFYALQKYGTDQTIVQRFLTARSDRDAIKASLIGVLLCVPMWTLFMFIGTALWGFYRITHASLPAGIKSDAIFPYFIKSQLPPGAMGFVVAALISSTLANLQSDLNCVSAACVEDCHRRIRPHASERERVIVGKSLVGVAGVLVVLVACCYARYTERNMLATMFDITAIFSAGIAGLFMLAFLTTRANLRGLYVGIAACIVFTAWAFVTSHTRGSDHRLILDLGRFNFTQPQLMVGVYSHVVLFAVGYLASFLFAADRDVTRLTIYGWLRKSPSPQAGLDAQPAASRP